MDRDAAIWQANETLEIAGREIRVSRNALLQLIFAASSAVQWSGLSQELAEVQPAALQTIILYNLACDVCSAEQIAASADRPVVRYLLGKGSLDWQIVHEFRRKNSRQIEESLRRLFTSLTGNPAAATEAARSRLRRAIQADSMVLDD